jgi:primosomal protein N'
MDLKCPTCHNPLELIGTHGHCHGCDKDYALNALCPECQSRWTCSKPAERWTISASRATA